MVLQIPDNINPSAQIKSAVLKPVQYENRINNSFKFI